MPYKLLTALIILIATPALLGACAHRAPAPGPEQGAAWATSNVYIYPSVPASVETPTTAPTPQTETQVFPTKPCVGETCLIPIDYSPDYPPELGSDGQPLGVSPPSSTSPSPDARWLLVGLGALLMLAYFSFKSRGALILSGCAFAAIFLTGCSAMHDLGEGARGAMGIAGVDEIIDPAIGLIELAGVAGGGGVITVLATMFAGFLRNRRKKS